MLPHSAASKIFFLSEKRVGGEKWHLPQRSFVSSWVIKMGTRCISYQLSVTHRVSGHPVLSKASTIPWVRQDIPTSLVLLTHPRHSRFPVWPQTAGSGSGVCPAGAGGSSWSPSSSWRRQKQPGRKHNKLDGHPKEGNRRREAEPLSRRVLGFTQQTFLWLLAEPLKPSKPTPVADKSQN